MVDLVHPLLLNNTIKDKEHKIILAWSPRAGCSVSCQMMFEHMGILQEALAYHRFIHKYRTDKYHKDKRFEHPPTSQEMKEWFVFKVIMNPFLRAVSSYHHFCSNKYQPDDCNKSFYEYLRLIDEKRITNSDAIYHCRPQYIINEEKVVDAYVKIEKGQADIDEKVNKPHGFHFKISDKTSGHHSIRSDYTKFLGFTKYDDIGVLPNSYSNFYSPEYPQIRALVEKIYAKDFEHYGYRFEDMLK